MKLERNPRIQTAILELHKKLSTMPYGSKMNWEELKKSGKTQLDTPQVYYVITKVNELLMRDNNRYLRTIKNFGKQIINPNEHREEARNTIKKSATIYKKAGRILNATELDKLTQDEKRQVMDDANRFRTLELFQGELLKTKKIGMTTTKKETKDKEQLIYEMLDILRKE